LYFDFPAKGIEINGDLCACLQIRQRLQAKTLLKTFGEIGWAAKSGIEGGLRDVSVFVSQKIQGLQ
jgi:hypothetical protein